MKKGDRTNDRRFPLLVYKYQWETVVWPAILALLACVAMLVWNPLPFRPYRFMWLIAVCAIIGLAFARWSARRQGYVEICEDDFVIHSSRWELRVLLETVGLTRPTLVYKHFPSELVQTRAMEPIRPYLDRSAVVVELKEWPRPPDEIRKNLGAYVLAQDCVGLILTVEDVVPFHRKLSTALEAWRYRSLPSPGERFRRDPKDEPNG